MSPDAFLSQKACCFVLGWSLVSVSMTAYTATYDLWNVFFVAKQDGITHGSLYNEMLALRKFSFKINIVCDVCGITGFEG